MTVAQAATAKRLVDAKGRSVTFIQLDAGTDDANQPWRGKADARATPANSVTLIAAFVPPSGVALGAEMALAEDLVKRSEQIMLVAPGTDQRDFSAYDEVIDTDGTRWKIIFSDLLKPAEIAILWSIGVRR